MLNRTIFAMAMSIVVLCASDSYAAVVSINFTRGAFTGEPNNPDGLQLPGAAVNGWNDFGFGGGGSTPQGPFTTTEGPAFSFNMDSSGTWNHQPFGAFPLQRQGAWRALTTVPWELTGLTPGQDYDIIFYAQDFSRRSLLTVDGFGAPTVDTDGDSNFLSITADVAGRISGTWGPDANDALAAIQFNESPVPPTLPEPSTFILAALGLVGFVGTRRRRRNRG